MIYDDIGSFPPPDRFTHEWMQKAFHQGNMRKTLFEMIRDAMRQKIEAGVEVPNYPQYQDMNQQFLQFILKENYQERPYIIKERYAQLVELQALEPLAHEYREQTGRQLKIRVCLTGPVELHHKALGSNVYPDVLYEFAESVRRFAASAQSNPGIDVCVVSIDEPGLGIIPDLNIDDETCIRALEIAISGIRGDAQIHLHSPLKYDLALQVRGLDVVGVESASDPQQLLMIDPKELEASDKFLRVGVSRTDIHAMAAEYNERWDVNVWNDPVMLGQMVDEETPALICKRLQNAFERFGDRIKYVGPDCGLGSWPSQALAKRLLANTASGIRAFKEDLR